MSIIGLNIMVTKVIFDLYENFKILMRRMNLSCLFSEIDIKLRHLNIANSRLDLY